MAIRTGTVYPRRLNKGSIRGSMWAPEHDIKHLNKVESLISRNFVNVTMKMKSILQIF